MDWTKPGSFSAGRDPLGFQAASVRLYTSLVPGLTNVTNRLRYYSYYCWVLWQFEQLHHSSREDRWIEFIRRAEYVLALACQVGDRENATGMAGSEWAGTEANRAELEVFDLISPTDRPGKDGQYLKAKFGNFGQFYVASMLEMEMISHMSGRIYGVTAGVGRPMAQAVHDENGSACKLVLKAIEDGSVSRSDCMKISESLHPANIIGTSQEAALLRVFLEGSREDDQTGLQRRISLKNVLTIVSSDTNRLELRAGLYAQAWRSDSATGDDDNLNRWRAYFVNEYSHIALEVWLNAVVGVANGGSALSVSEIARRVTLKALSNPMTGVEQLTNLLFIKRLDEIQTLEEAKALREDIFVDADGKVGDKEFFYVFDYLGNLDYFNAEIERRDAAGTKPLGERLFAARVDLLGLMQPTPRTGGLQSPGSGYRGEEEGLYEGVRSQLIREVAGMPTDNFIVRAKRRHVEKFQDKSAWDHLSEEDRHELVEHVAALPTSEVDTDVDAKRFDLLCLRIQLAMLRKKAFEPLRKAFVEQVHSLEAKAAVPDVAKQMELILEVQTSDWWADAPPQMVEIARRRLRGLMSLIEPGGQVIVRTDIIDDMGEKREVELLDLGGASSLAQFRKKARAYIDAHTDHVTLARLRQGKPLTAADLNELQRLLEKADIASSADFVRIRAMPDLPEFVRSLVGLDRNAAQVAFNEALAGKTLSAQQIRFVEMIVDHLTASGRMEPELLYAPPFTDSAPNGVNDVFEMTDVSRIIETIEKFAPRMGKAGDAAG